jgi:hypothetical protein
MVCAEEDDVNVFEGIVKIYKLISDSQGWENREILMIPSVNKIGDINTTNGFELAKNIGLNIL